MHHIGFNSGEFAKSGNALALSECNVKYMRPLRTRDMFNSRAWVTKVSATSFHLYQELVKIEQDEQACKEEVRALPWMHKHSMQCRVHEPFHVSFRLASLQCACPNMLALLGHACFAICIIASLK